MSGRTMNMPERESRKRIRRRRKRRRPPHGAFPFRKEEGSAARRAGDPASARSCRSGHVHVHVRAEQGGLPASEQIWSGWTFVLSLQQIGCFHVPSPVLHSGRRRPTPLWAAIRIRSLSPEGASAESPGAFYRSQFGICRAFKTRNRPLPDGGTGEKRRITESKKNVSRYNLPAALGDRRRRRALLPAPAPEAVPRTPRLSDLLHRNRCLAAAHRTRRSAEPRQYHGLHALRHVDALGMDGRRPAPHALLSLQPVTSAPPRSGGGPLPRGNARMGRHQRAYRAAGQSDRNPFGAAARRIRRFPHRAAVGHPSGHGHPARTGVAAHRRLGRRPAPRPRRLHGRPGEHPQFGTRRTGRTYPRRTRRSLRRRIGHGQSRRGHLY